VAKRKTRKSTAKVTSIHEVRSRVGKIRQDVEEVVDNLRKRAVRALPAGQRKQVDEVFDRISSVGHDVNKTVGGWRADLEKQFRTLRGTVDKRVTTIRKQTESRSRTLLTSVEEDVRKYVDGVFKRFQLPVHSDIEGIKRRLGAIERRLASLETHESRAA
jgi:ABC-type transporter Mla subunit MlaD